MEASGPCADSVCTMRTLYHRLHLVSDLRRRPSTCCGRLTRRRKGRAEDARAQGLEGKAEAADVDRLDGPQHDGRIVGGRLAPASIGLGREFELVKHAGREEEGARRKGTSRCAGGKRERGSSGRGKEDTERPRATRRRRARRRARGDALRIGQAGGRVSGTRRRRRGAAGRQALRGEAGRGRAAANRTCMRGHVAARPGKQRRRRRREADDRSRA